MKTEDFDDAIRKKINSIHTTYKESEVDRIHNFVGKNNPASFSVKFGKALLVSAVGIVVAGLIILNVIQLKKHDTLVEKIDTLQKNQAELKQQLENSNSQQKFTKTKEELSTENLTLKDFSDKNNLSTKTESKKDLITENSALKNQSLAKENEIVINENNKKQSLNQKQFNADNIVNRSEITNQQFNKTSKNEKVFEPKTNVNNITDKLEKNELKPDELAKNEKEAADQSKKEIKSDTSFIALEKTNTDSVATDSFSVALEKEKNIRSIDLQKEESKKEKLFSKIQFSVGLGAEKAVRMNGFSVPVQVAFTDNWSIYSGVKLASIHDIRFRDEREFKTQEGREIRTEYGSPMPDSAFIQNIERTRKLIQIPLALAYHFPLKNDFSLVFSSGTDLNLAAFHSISYELRRRNVMPAHLEKKEIENVRRPVPLFNNANISFGAQKRWENFSVQLNPYLMSHFRKVGFNNNNKNIALIPGVGFRLLYNI